jgi:hypothetical protein
MTRNLWIRLLWIGLVGTAIGTAHAETAERLFSDAGAPAMARAIEPEVLRHRYVRLSGPEPGAKVRLNLFEDEERDFLHARTDANVLGGNVWIGKPARGDGYAFLSRVGDITVGNIWVDDRMYELRYSADGVHRVTEIDQGAYADEGCSPPEDVLNLELDDTPSAAPEPPAAPHGAGDDPCGVIDLMVLYTPEALEDAGDAAAMEALIHMAISVTNLSLEDSDVNPRFSPVHIDEIDYLEADQENPGDEEFNVFDDRNRLRNPNDGYMDEVHELRDRYCADIVHLITDTGGGWCGAAYIQQNAPDPLHEEFGFAVTKDSCAVGNRTFAHEMGHTMGAQHDWYKDDSTDPYSYAHGHIDLDENYRTIMSYSDKCTDSGENCPRKGYWSNPDIDYSGTPTGVASGTDTSCAKDNLNNPDCDADNARVLDNTACTVANFRKRSECGSSSSRNVWMKDTWFDTGMEPDPFTVGQKMWKSPYIWVRNQFDPTGEFQHIHENPEFGSTNYVYVKLHNDFDTAATGQLLRYYANASAGLAWPGDWTEFANVNVNIAAHATLLQPTSWQPPGTGHYCLLARWDTPNAPADPMTFPEGASVNDNTRNNNNIVWRNVNILDTTPNEQYVAPPFNTQNLDPTGGFVSIGIELPDAPADILTRGGRVWLDMGDALAPWLAAGGNGSGIQLFEDPLLGTLVEIVGSPVGGPAVASIDQVPLPPFQNVPMRLVVESPVVPFPPNPQDANDDPAETTGPQEPGQAFAPGLPGGNVFEIDVVQHQLSGPVGGVGYEVHVQPTSDGAGAVPNGDSVPGVPLTVDKLGTSLLLEWQPSCLGSDTDYSVHVGTLGDFTSHVPEVCTTGGATTSLVDVADEDQYFLIVPNDGAADGSYGVDSTGAERSESLAACRLSIPATCSP